MSVDDRGAAPAVRLSDVPDDREAQAVRVESEEGVGSTFTIELPLAAVAGMAAGATAPGDGGAS